LLSLVLANLGYLAGHRGAHGEARGLIKDALRLAWEHGYRLQAGWFLCELAGPELALGDPARAARLTGAGEAALSALGATHYAGDAAELRRIKADVIAVLGDEAYRKEHAAGALLGLEDAVRRALEDDDERPAR
jgi:hypothetical protein